MTTDNTQELDDWGEDELLQRLVVYMSFYVEARDAKSVEDMGKWIHKILSMITGAYSDGFQKASKGAFKSQQSAKREAVEAVLDRLDSSMPTPEQLTTKYGYHMPEKQYGYKLGLHDIREVIEAERKKLTMANSPQLEN